MDSKDHPAEKKGGGQVQKTQAPSFYINLLSEPKTNEKTTVKPLIGRVIDIQGQSSHQTHSPVPFSKNLKSTPSIITSLVGFRDNEEKWNKHWVSATNVRPEGFTIERHCTKRGSNSWTQAQWMALLYPEHSSIQTGEWILPWQSLPLVTDTFVDSIQFPRSFPSIPEVTVWFSGFELFHSTVGSPVCLSVDAYEITCTGFSLDFDKIAHNSSENPDVSIYGVKVSWLAYDPTSSPGICSGTAYTWEFRPDRKPQHFNTGYIRFGEGTFKSTPKIMIGINDFEFGARVKNQLKVSVSEVSTKGMCWHADSADDDSDTEDSDGTELTAAGISYIAMEW